MFGKNYEVTEEIAQEYVWVVEYNDETDDSEFSGEAPYNFYKIKREEIKQFGLLGKKKSFYFDSEGGALYLDGKKVEIRYREKDEVFNLAGDSNKKTDIITYKKATSTARIAPSGTFIPSIVSYHMGYKDEIVLEDGTIINFKPIVNVLRNDGGFYVEVSMTCSRELSGVLEFYVDGVVTDSYDAPLEEGIKGIVNWSL